MAITLSNGISLEPTSQRDSRGLQVYTDSVGNLYVNSGGQWLLSRNVGVQPTGNPQADIIARESASRLRTFQPELPAYEVPGLEEFRGQSEEEIGEFFDKSLELLSRKVEQERRQATEVKDVGLGRLGEDRQTYFQNEDTSFARALEATQAGFAGRGVFTSGFRLKAV